MTDRPSELPEWATNDNYSTGPDIGTATKVTLSAGDIADGNIAEQAPSPQKFNYWMNLVSRWLEYGNIKWVGYQLNGALHASTTDATALVAAIQPAGMFWSNDGAKLFVAEAGNDAYEFLASTPWDPTTLSYDSGTYQFSGISTYSLVWSDDGSSAFVYNFTDGVVHRFDASTAWDLTSLSSAGNTFDTSTQASSDPRGMSLGASGTKLYVSDITNDRIYQYTLSTPWDLTTASYDTKSLDTSPQDSAPYDWVFNDDGTRLFVIGDTNDTVFQYSLSTAWDLSTASYDSVSLDVGAFESNPWGITLTADGTKMLVCGASGYLVEFYTSRMVKA